jgi:hypothetical protein
LEIRLPFSEDTQNIISENDLDNMGYDKKWGRYRLRIHEEILKNKTEVLSKILELAYKESI